MVRNMLNKLCALLTDVRRDESGTVVIEYTMIASVVAAAIVGAIQLLSTNLDALLLNMANAFS